MYFFVFMNEIFNAIILVFLLVKSVNMKNVHIRLYILIEIL